MGVCEKKMINQSIRYHGSCLPAAQMHVQAKKSQVQWGQNLPNGMVPTHSEPPVSCNKPFNICMVTILVNNCGKNCCRGSIRLGIFGMAGAIVKTS